MLLLTANFSRCSAQPAVDRAPDPTISSRDRAYVASKIYAAIGLYFAHFEAIPDFDLEAAYSTFLDEAYKAPGRYEFDLACLEFMAQLKNGHSGFSDPWLRETRGQSFGFSAQHIENKWVVTTSRIPEIASGDVIEKIDGKPAEEFYQDKKKYISSSNDWAARERFYTMRFLFPQEFTLTLESGRLVKIQRRPIEPQEENTIGKWITKDKIAYIKIPAFHEPKFEAEALKLVNDYKDAATLIIDIRGNGGGSTPGTLIDALMDRPYRSQGQSTPVNVAVWKVRAGFFEQLEKDPKTPRDETFGYLAAMKEMTANAMHYQPAITQKPGKPIFKGKLIVLIDRHVFSAGEDFCIPFKDNHRATFVGETSGGSTGQPFYFEFPNTMNFRVSSKRDCFPNGSTFEGIGITPDVDIPTTIADLRSGKDPILEKALELAK